jgi:protoheme IX farnesyltransferase
MVTVSIFLKSKINNLRSKFLPLIKSLQTGLLLSTGMAGYLSVHNHVVDGWIFLALSGSLFLAISGSTALNMWYDRDIDAKMKRTCLRPLPDQKISPPVALRFGLVLSILGVGWATALSPLYGLIVFIGLFFDVILYTIWLKRRSPWSIVWGGISGGMPILAGRALATGHVDGIGLLLSLAVLFWIPTHILTFATRYIEDYENAGVPIFPSVYGFDATRKIIAISSVLASIAMSVASVWIGITAGALRLLVVLSIGLLFLALTTWMRPSDKVNFGLFKYASLYMVCAMILLAIGAL